MAIKKSELYRSLWQSCDELRGGMDASQYKDYILVLLFVKYVSDKYGQKGSLLEVPKGASFGDMIALKGNVDIGEKINKIVARLAEANDLQGVIDVADFNNPEKLGSGKTMVDTLSKLVGIFQGLDFSGNRAAGDDLLGDAYEYLMRHFATESGKSKGQFYTPAEVSRIMAKVIGIDKATSSSQSLYDPTCGSGSLLLKAHDEAKDQKNIDISIFGQEMDVATRAMAKMNMILHNCPSAEIKRENTLASPEFKHGDSLKTFDFVVANPPFSTKAWSNGIDPAHDIYKRFEYGIPPAKNGDYAFLLHIIASLKSTGKGAIILPHGVLFRGNVEADIRKRIVQQGFIKGIIGLPANLFYGTGIPACIIVLDKEDASKREGIFMIDASKGFIKDGNKNRLREQDIHKAVDVVNNQLVISKYSRLVPLDEIVSNDYNLNIPRYIDSTEPEDRQDIDAHLNGGIPNRDIDDFSCYWDVFPSIRSGLFTSADRTGYSKLKIAQSDIKKAIPTDFKAKGDIYVFVDECHRSQSGDLHRAMKAILPDALFIGFTGTPLLKTDKQKSIEVFGRYIHTYKFNEAVQDKVVLDLRYEARDIDQNITSQQRIDQWFEAKTRGLTDLAKAQLKQKWGTMQRVRSNRSRLEKIVDDILVDMLMKPRLMDGHGNAMLVSGSIYEACLFYELFSKTDLAGKCAIITSYSPSAADIKGEETGEGETEKQHKFATYRKMLADWFKEDEEKAVRRSEEFETAVKKKFIEEPGQMKLVIVVDKLLTGFDAPSATYLYIDKQMRDHGLFQAICRVNRLDGEDKQYGYIIDYKDLFKGLEKAVQDYTSGALDGYDKTDVEGLLKDRLEEAKDDLEEAREVIKALCEPVEIPKDLEAYLRYFCGTDSGKAAQIKDNESKRLKLYKFTGALLRAYCNLANELTQAGYSDVQIIELKNEVAHFELARNEVKLASGDYIDLKLYEPAMRHLIDTYIRAEESQKISAFDDLSLIQLIVQRGADVIDMLPNRIKQNKKAVAETIENNVRKIITDEQPINPKYYERMSDLLDALIEKRRQEAIDYEQYLAEIVALTKQVNDPGLGAAYPKDINTPAKRALYDNLDQDLDLAISIDHAVISTKKDDWRGNMVKEREVKYAIRSVLPDDNKVETIFELVKKQHEY